MKPRPLSPQQAKILRKLQRVRRQGELPQLSELARDLGLHYTTLRQHLEALATKGYVRFQSRGTGRSPQLELLGFRTGVPVVGDIPAGALSAAIESADGYLALSGDAGYFALQVRGDSMADLIQDGDLVLLDKDAPPRPGEICAVRLEDDVTLKYLEWTESAPQWRVLRPHNPFFPTLQVEAKSVHVEGVYRGLLRGSVIQTLLK